MKEYLRIQQPELAQIEIDMQKKLEHSILCGSTTQADSTIDYRAEIRLRLARKWLNHLGYKWKDI